MGKLTIKARGFDSAELGDEPERMLPGFIPRERPGLRRFDATTNVYGKWSYCRYGATVEDAVRDTLEIIGQDYGEDIALWEDGRLVAVIRMAEGAEAEVHVYDEDE